MKLFISILCISSLIFICSCAHKCICPKEDVIFPVTTPIGPLTIRMEKGFFSDKENKDFWMTLEKYKELMEQENDPSSQEKEEVI